MVEVIGDSANAERVAHNLQVAADELMAMFNKTGMDRYDGYIRWVNSHVRMLAGQISQRDIDALLQIRGYWSLRAGDPATLAENLNDIITDRRG